MSTDESTDEKWPSDGAWVRVVVEGRVTTSGRQMGRALVRKDGLITAHVQAPLSVEVRCDPERGTHVDPHKGCILR